MQPALIQVAASASLVSCSDAGGAAHSKIVFFFRWALSTFPLFDAPSRVQHCARWQWGTKVWTAVHKLERYNHTLVLEYYSSACNPWVRLYCARVVPHSAVSNHAPFIDAPIIGGKGVHGAPAVQQYAPFTRERCHTKTVQHNLSALNFFTCS
jgi:hypothetical protein